MVEARLGEHVEDASRRRPPSGRRCRRRRAGCARGRSRPRTSRTARASRRASCPAGARSRARRAASRIASISAWARRVLAPLALVVAGADHLAAGARSTAPTGTSSCASARSASAIASRIKRRRRGASGGTFCHEIVALDTRGCPATSRRRSCCTRPAARPALPTAHAARPHVRLPPARALAVPGRSPRPRSPGAAPGRGDRPAATTPPARSSCATRRRRARPPARPRSAPAARRSASASRRGRACCRFATGAAWRGDRCASAGRDVLSATAELDRARSSFVPNDPGRAGTPAGWQALQWNFRRPPGVNAPAAWDAPDRGGAPGGRGVIVAVLDTGVAYADRGRLPALAGLQRSRFVRGYDFVDDDPYPQRRQRPRHARREHDRRDTRQRHRRHRARLRRDDHAGPRARPRRRRATRRGSRAASARRSSTGAKVINLSFEFALEHHRAQQIPDILDALRYAARKGVLVVGASGNAAAAARSPTRRARATCSSVGATTEHGCQADYSNDGPRTSTSSRPAAASTRRWRGDPNCRPARRRRAATSSR